MPGPRPMQMAKPKNASKTFFRVLGYMGSLSPKPV